MTAKDEVSKEALRTLTTRALVYLHRRGFDNEEAMDVCQEAIVKYLSFHAATETNLGQPDVTRGFWSVLQHEALAARRKRRERLSSGASDPETALEGREEADLLRRALEKLPPEEREVLRLHHFESQSRGDIAKALSVPESTVRHRLRRGRELLRSALEREGYWQEIHKSAKNSLSIVVDADVDNASMAAFLGELADAYRELSGGDVLIIREGRIPVPAAEYV